MIYNVAEGMTIDGKENGQKIMGEQIPLNYKILEKELDVRLCFLLFLNSFVSLSFKFNTQAVAPLYIPPSVPSEKFGKLTGADSEPKRAFE